jgi:hypothetical protein
METEEISEMLASSSGLTLLIARGDFSGEVVYEAKFIHFSYS